jgi:hypothetical protein
MRLTTGLRPIRSDTPPQYMPLRASLAEKAAIKQPAKNGALDSDPTSKLETSFQAYGSIDVNAIGSATRTRALDWSKLHVRSQVVMAESTYRRASCAVGKSLSETSWGLVLCFVRFDILQPDLILTATPTRSQPKAQGRCGCCVSGAFSAFGLVNPEADNWEAYHESKECCVEENGRGERRGGMGKWKWRWESS